MSIYHTGSSENQSILILRDSPSNEHLFHKIESEYLYWNKVKYLGDAGNSEELWKEVKLSRKLISKKLSIFSNNKIVINYGINDYLQQKLHYLDFNFGAGIQKEQLLNDIDKQNYLTNALMEESIFSSKISLNKDCFVNLQYK